MFEVAAQANDVQYTSTSATVTPSSTTAAVTLSGTRATSVPTSSSSGSSGTKSSADVNRISPTFVVIQALLSSGVIGSSILAYLAGIIF